MDSPASSNDSKVGNRDGHWMGRMRDSPRGGPTAAASHGLICVRECAIAFLARFARGWHPAIKRGRRDPPFSPREKPAGTAG